MYTMSEHVVVNEEFNVLLTVKTQTLNYWLSISPINHTFVTNTVRQHY